jgi:hypothetical protein
MLQSPIKVVWVLCHRQKFIMENMEYAAFRWIRKE